MVQLSLLLCCCGLKVSAFGATSSITTRQMAHSQLAAVVSEDAEGTAKRRFMYMTEEEDSLLREKGDHEAKLMSQNIGPLRANKAKASASGGGGRGFGGSAGKKKESSEADFSAAAKAHAKVIKKDGIVRIDNVLSEELADSLKEYLVDLRARGTADVENGTILDSQERFADVLLNQNRCDLKIPLGPEPVNQALNYVLHQTPIKSLIEHVFDSYGGGGKEATLYEVNCFMSNSGARRQLVHADNVCVDVGVLEEDEPIMLTCFIALQDTDVTMGPTVWILGTHNRESHAQFYETNQEKPSDPRAESSTDRLLRTGKKVIGTLPKGSCAVFDPRTLHCAGANECEDPDATRALFYISFKSPRVDYPGCPSCSGFGIADAELTLQELSDGLTAQAQHKASRRLDFLACFP